MFVLEEAIKVWKSSLRKNRALEDGYIEELESHLRDEVDRNIAEGKEGEEAFLTAVKRIGEIENVGAEYFKSDTTHINKRPPWKANPWMPSLFANYFKIAARNIKRNKGYSFITTFGLSVGIAAFILISFYVNNEFSYDRFNANYDNIYRVVTHFHGHTHAGVDKMAVVRSPLGPAMVDDIPEVLSSFRMKRSSDIKITVDGTDFHQQYIYYSEPAVFDILTLPIIRGERKNLLDDPNTAVISESLAKKLFGDQNPLGKTITVRGEDDIMVSAVMKDMPANSHFNAEIFLSLKYYSNKFEEDLTQWRRSSTYTYLLLSPDSDLSIIENMANSIAEKNTPQSRHGHKATFLLQKLGDIHINSQFDAELDKNNNINTVYLFSIIGILILFIACLNYMNLTTARSLKRAKEVGIRKTIGAGKRNIIKQFLTESTTLTYAALLVSLIIIWLVLPYFNSYVEREFTFTQIMSVDFILFGILTTLLVGVAAGSYPAFIISSFKPVNIFNQKFEKSKGGYLFRNIFIVLQFSIAIILIVCTLVIENQLSFISSTNVGYSKDQIVTISTRSSRVREKLDIMKTELLSNPNILNVASSSYLPNQIRDQTSFNWPGNTDEVEYSTYAGFADYEWINLFDIEIVEGRNFSKEFTSDAQGAFLINETAVKALGWDEPIGKELIHWNDNTGKVVGVMKDFNFHSLHREIESLYIYFEPIRRNYYLSCKISAGAIPETIAFMEETMDEFMPEYPFEYSFFDEVFNEQYKDEIKMQELFSTFALIAILLSGLGLLGLASYTTERRTKEIGIRKIMGASSSGVVIMLTKEFTKWVLIANIVAWPVAYYFMQKWLQDFAFKTELSIWLFLISGLIALVIAGITVVYQAIRAATANPVNSLRYE